MSDYPVEESVCLLRRSHWFEAYLKVLLSPPSINTDTCNQNRVAFCIRFRAASPYHRFYAV